MGTCEPNLLEIGRFIMIRILPLKLPQPLLRNSHSPPSPPIPHSPSPVPLWPTLMPRHSPFLHPLIMLLLRGSVPQVNFKPGPTPIKGACLK
jgi:hypothetical protein